MERLELSNKPKLFITKELCDKIDWLHDKVGKNEWSGELITSEKGTINDLESWEITAEDLFLADIGTGAFTGYKVDEGGFKSADVVELYDAFPALLEGEKKLQHIHSHHNMSCFFSGTDWENLEDRASISNYFLMLIVNFDGKWCAKVAFKAKKSGGGATTLDFVNNEDGYQQLKLKGSDDKHVLVVMDCAIEIEGNIEVSEEFETRFNKVKGAVEAEKKRKEEEAKKKHSSSYPAKGSHLTKHKGGAYGTPQWEQGEMWREVEGEEDWQNEWELIDGIWTKKDKKPKRISEMTEQEWKDSQTGIGKFELRHAKAYLNSILDGTYSSYDFTDPMKKIDSQEAKLVTEDDIEKYIDEFEELLQEHFDIIFPYKTVVDYVALLEEVIEYLIPYIFQSPLVKEMVDSINEEIKLVEGVTTT